MTDEALIARLSIRHSVSADAVRTVLRGLRSAGGRMAQFSHADFGGMSQWSPGMTMIGDMFNNDLKAKLDAICTELASHVANAESHPNNHDGRDENVSYRSAARSEQWWPAGYGAPSSVGAQNALRCAVFPDSGGGGGDGGPTFGIVLANSSKVDSHAHTAGYLGKSGTSGLPGDTAALTNAPLVCAPAQNGGGAPGAVEAVQSF